jgi:hypothetical protein
MATVDSVAAPYRPVIDGSMRVDGDVGVGT